MAEEKETMESESSLDVDEIELALRRFATKTNDQPLTKLINSLFPQSAEDLIKEESSESKSEKEGD